MQNFPNMTINLKKNPKKNQIKSKISSLQTISKSSRSDKSSESLSENSNSWYHPRGAGRTKKISKKGASSWRTNGKRKTPGEGWKTSWRDSIHHKILECITENILRYLRYPSWGLKNKREILKQKHTKKTKKPIYQTSISSGLSGSKTNQEAGEANQSHSPSVAPTTPRRNRESIWAPRGDQMLPSKKRWMANIPFNTASLLDSTSDKFTLKGSTALDFGDRS